MSLEPGRPPEQVADGCWRITLPDPYPPGVVAVYLLETGNEPVLLDVGPPGDEAAAALDDGLARMGLEGADPGAVVLSHHHLDHVGGLAARAGASRLVAHAATAERLGRDRGDGADRAEALLCRAGVPAGTRARLRRYREPDAAGESGNRRVDRRLEGDKDPLEEAPEWRWVRVRGHAPGHLLLHRPADGTMLSSDQFMRRLKTPLSLEDPDADPWGAYLRSLDRAAGAEPTTMFPAHTGPIRPAGPWLERRRRSMGRTLERIADAVTEGAKTAWEATEVVYPRDPGPGRKALLVRETLAGLRRLAATGEARRRLEEGVERYGPA